MTIQPTVPSFRRGVKVFLLLLFALSLVGPQEGKAMIGQIQGETDGDGGCYLTFDADGLFLQSRCYTGDFSQFSLGNFIDYYQKEVGELKVNYYLFCYGNNTPQREIGFDYWWAGKESRLLVTGYGDGATSAPGYIESIEIAWNEIGTYCEGALTILGRAGAPERAFAPEDIYSRVSNDCDERIDASKTDGSVCVYSFSSPVNYIAIYNYRGDGAIGDNKSVAVTNIAAVKYIRIHFVAEAPAGKERLVLGNGEEDQTLDVEWKNTRIDLSLPSLVCYADSNEDVLADAELVNSLSFTLSPAFPPQEKPSTAQRDELIMTEEEWNLYRLLETYSDIYPYDGYLTSSEDIACTVADGKLTVPAPCSGLYTLRVTSPLATVTPSSIALNIWPGIKNSYSWLAGLPETTEAGWTPYYEFNINGRRADDSLIVQYPYADSEDTSSGAYSSDDIRISVPGLYGAEIYYIFSSDNVDAYAAVGRRGATREDLEKDGYKSLRENPITFESLTSLTPVAYLDLRMLKNGAVTPLSSNNSAQSENHIKIQLSTEVTVGYHGIATEEGGAEEYFTLQGLRVDPSLVSPGNIVIRKRGYKVEKILF